MEQWSYPADGAEIVLGLCEAGKRELEAIPHLRQLLWFFAKVPTTARLCIISHAELKGDIHGSSSK